MDPITTAALITTGGSLLGGLMSKGPDVRGLMNKQLRQNMQLFDHQFNANSALQREFAQNGIRWKVEDAEAAGLHPLYALGAATSPSSPIHLGGGGGISADGGGGNNLAKFLHEAGQNIGRAVAAQKTPEERIAEQLRLQLLQAQIGTEDARREHLLSEAARNRQAAGPGMPEGINAVPFPVSAPISAKDLNAIPLSDVIQVKPADVVSSRSNDRSTTAGLNPWFDEHMITPWGLKFKMPRSSEPGETWAEMPWYQKGWYMAKNALAHDDPLDWMNQWYQQYVLNRAPRYVTRDPEYGNSRYAAPHRRDHTRARRPTLK